jgi:hypothetical protein
MAKSRQYIARFDDVFLSELFRFILPRFFRFMVRRCNGLAIPLRLTVFNEINRSELSAG